MAFGALTAAPGGIVSVLWGLVQYTKADLSVKNDTAVTARPTTRQTSKGNQMVTTPPQLPIAISGNLDIVHSVTNENVETVLSALRNKRQLRGLEALESGHQLANTSRGTYFFLYGPYLDKYPGGKSLDLGRFEVDRFRETNSYFEIHLPQTGEPIIIGFTSKSDAARIAGSNRETSKISVSPIPWEKMTSMVSLPANTVLSAKKRTLSLARQKSIEILDLEITTKRIKPADSLHLPLNLYDARLNANRRTER